jgi:hypothetical protein
VRRGGQGEPGHDSFFSAGLNIESLREEIFFLAYNLHWSWSEIMGLTTAERREFVKLLAKQIERENAQIKAARER